MCEAIILAKYIVSKCVKDGQPISNLQLQKILFYIQEAFVKKNDLAFSDNIEAWQFGPVIPNVYYRFAGYGSMAIRNEYEDSINEYFDTDEIALINSIIESKRTLDPWVLVEETHAEGGAWAKVYNRGSNNIISPEIIKESLR